MQKESKNRKIVNMSDLKVIRTSQKLINANQDEDKLDDKKLY